MTAPHEERQPKMLERALEYLQLGYPIFPVCSPAMGQHQHRGSPCKNVGKRPLINWEAFQTRLPTINEVRTWWERWPQANIGMATGALSGVVVLDCDSGSARQLAMERGGVDRTPAVFTGKPGGVHYWLAHPGEEVHNFARKLPGLDFRGDGGYVLVPPSRHASGADYRWVNDTAGSKPSPLPGWLVDLLHGAPATTDAPAGDHQPLDLAQFVTGVPEGRRDDALWSLAGKMRADNVPRQYADAMIRQAARACDPAFDEDEALEKVARAYKLYEPEPLFKVQPVEPVVIEPTRFLRPISELLAMQETEPDWMVQDLFTVGSSGWIGAEAKVGKSWIGLELGYALTTATKFLGKFDVKQRRRVIYIQEEDSVQRVLRRFKRLIQGTPGRVYPDDAYFKWSVRSGFRIDDEVWIANLRAELEAFKAEVVILDVFNRLHQKNENDQTDMLAVLSILTALTAEFGVSFVVVHHNKKGTPGFDIRPNQLLRGSSALAGWAECSLYLRKGKQRGTFIVTPESKDAAEIDEFSVLITDVDNGGVVLQTSEVSVADRIGDMQTKIAQAVEALEKEGLDATISRIADRLKVDRKTVQKYVTDLVSAGILGEDEVMIGKSNAKMYFNVSQ